jgi:hypothetical protein
VLAAIAAVAAPVVFTALTVRLVAVALVAVVTMPNIDVISTCPPTTLKYVVVVVAGRTAAARNVVGPKLLSRIALL